MSTTSTSSIPLAHPELRVLIIGAGVGGLMLGNLLEKANIPYLILEKASAFKPLGSAISLGPPVFTSLDQLGIFDDLLHAGFHYKDLSVQGLDLDSGKMKYKGTFNSKVEMVERFGYPTLMIARPDLMEALLKPIPKSKILMKKKVSVVHQNEDGVTVKTEDGSEYKGDILVGADGCYSSVREAMYKAILARGDSLPANDTAPLDYNIDCIVGVSEPLDLNDYPALDTDKCEFQVVLPNQQTVSIWYMPLSRNRMGWMINECMTKERKAEIGPIYGSGNNNVKASDWNGDAAMEMCKRYGQHPTPYGTKLQDIIDKTKPELISKVMLEEKFFETWTDGRICLVGDACHKVLPFGAVGATNAMLDAVQLANLLYDIKSNSHQEIQSLLTEYYTLRKEYGRDAVKGSSSSASLFHKKGLMANLSRYFILNMMPDFVLRKAMHTRSAYRPRCIYLPYDPAKAGSAPVIKQTYSERYLMEQTAVVTATTTTTTTTTTDVSKTASHDVEENLVAKAQDEEAVVV